MQKLVPDLLAFSRVGREGITLQSTDCNAALCAADLVARPALQLNRMLLAHPAFREVVLMLY